MNFVLPLSLLPRVIEPSWLPIHSTPGSLSYMELKLQQQEQTLFEKFITNNIAPRPIGCPDEKNAQLEVEEDEPEEGLESIDNQPDTEDDEIFQRDDLESDVDVSITSDDLVS
eukprot:TRINITY_DN2546_c0_g1_i1.p1 TRINITY_DN2546_c0_g1~~TRINITY_DN2546_c0_g1_i1.p1  ORF type:complete len:113 (-),score=26.19 TRINITY_DN2546_c0_g1_i1:73-411(-)